MANTCSNCKWYDSGSGECRVLPPTCVDDSGSAEAYPTVTGTDFCGMWEVDVAMTACSTCQWYNSGKCQVDPPTVYSVNRIKTVGWPAVSTGDSCCFHQT